MVDDKQEAALPEAQVVQSADAPTQEMISAAVEELSTLAPDQVRAVLGAVDGLVPVETARKVIELAATVTCTTTVTGSLTVTLGGVSTAPTKNLAAVVEWLAKNAAKGAVAAAGADAYKALKVKGLALLAASHMNTAEPPRADAYDAPPPPPIVHVQPVAPAPEPPSIVFDPFTPPKT